MIGTVGHFTARRPSYAGASSYGCGGGKPCGCKPCGGKSYGDPGTAVISRPFYAWPGGGDPTATLPLAQAIPVVVGRPPAVTLAEAAPVGVPVQRLGPPNLGGFGAWGRPGGYGGLFTKDAAEQCSKWQGKLSDYRSGNCGIFKCSGLTGLFSNEAGALEGKVEKWCGRAEAEAKAARRADQLVDGMVPQDPYATVDAGTTVDPMIYAVAGLGILGLGALWFVTQR
jgi:hypothetical protein